MVLRVADQLILSRIARSNYLHNSDRMIIFFIVDNKITISPLTAQEIKLFFCSMGYITYEPELQTPTTKLKLRHRLLNDSQSIWECGLYANQEFSRLLHRIYLFGGTPPPYPPAVLSSVSLHNIGFHLFSLTEAPGPDIQRFQVTFLIVGRNTSVVNYSSHGRSHNRLTIND